MVGYIRRAAIAAAAVAGLAAPAALAVSSAAPAGADTTACANASTTHNGTTADWCASQEIVSLGLEAATPNKAVNYARLTVKAAGANAATDWQFYPPAAGTGKIWESSPKGIASGLCMDVSNSGALPVLKTCVNSKLSQHWDAEQIGTSSTYMWVNESDGLALTDPSGGPAYTRLTLAAPVDATGQAWTYTQ